MGLFILYCLLGYSCRFSARARVSRQTNIFGRSIYIALIVKLEPIICMDTKWQWAYSVHMCVYFIFCCFSFLHFYNIPRILMSLSWSIHRQSCSICRTGGRTWIHFDNIGHFIWTGKSTAINDTFWNNVLQSISIFVVVVVVFDSNQPIH